MDKIKIIFLSLFVGCFFTAFAEGVAGRDSSDPDSLNTTIQDFRLPATSGIDVSLSDYPDALGFIIVFTSNNCPFAKLYPERLNELNALYKPKGIPLIAIRSTDVSLMPDDAFDKMVKLVKKQDLHFPYLADDGQEVAKNFHAEKTPHAFVIWKENDKWVVKYSGAIDDNGAEPQKVQHSYVKEALDDLLSGKKVRTPVTKSVGCAIKFRNSVKIQDKGQ